MNINIISEILRYLLHLIAPGYFIGKRKTQPDSGVVISLTTLPSRIANIKTTISSLLDQTVLPEKIIINTPKYSKREKRGYIIPSFLKNHPLIDVNETEEDLGPATKLLPSLKRYKQHDQLIIVADDDEIYPKRLIENYLTHRKDFNNSVMTLVGWNAPKDFSHSNRKVIFGAIGSKPKLSQKIHKPTQVDCVQGASTFAVKPSFFTDEIFDYENAPKEAFFVDDIWVSGNLAKNRIPVYVIPAPFRYARMKVPTHLILSETLHRKENKTGNNNNALYKHFQQYWHSKP